MRNLKNGILKFCHNCSIKVLLIGVILSLITALVVEEDVHKKIDYEHVAQFNRTSDLVSLSLEQFTHPLQGIGALYAAFDTKLDTKKFKKYSNARGDYANFPGALGFGFIRRIAKENVTEFVKSKRQLNKNFNLKRFNHETFHIQGDLFVIEMIEPEAPNKNALGLVISDESLRREAAILAMKSGQPTLTSSIYLVQTDRKGPGFLLYLPVYEGGVTPTSESERIKKLVGWAYAPIVAGSLVEFATKQVSNKLRFRIYESDDSGNLSPIYLSPAITEANPFELQWQTEFKIGGRKWLLQGDAEQHESYLMDHAEVSLTFAIGLALTFLISIAVKRKKIESQIKDQALSQARIETKEALERVEFEKEFLQMVINNLPMLISYWDRDLINRLGNNKYSDFLGKFPGDYVGMHMKEIVSPGFWDFTQNVIQRVLGGEFVEFEREIPTANGNTKPSLFKYLPHIHQDQVVGFFTIVVDISHVKMLEKANLETQAKLIARSKFSMLGEMASSMAHEINNPLAIVSGRVQLMGHHISKLPIPPSDQMKLQNNIGTIQTTIIRISNLIWGLRTFSKDADELPKEAVGLQSLLDDVLNLCRMRLEDHGIDFSCEGPLHLQVTCNRVQISQAVMSLVSNSIEAMEGLSKKWIKIQVEAEVASLKIKFIDAGAGIRPEVADQMMRPFYTTKELGKGPGLGLSICKGIIEQHGGEFYYDRQAPNTTFVIEVPFQMPQSSTHDRVA